MGGASRHGAQLPFDDEEFNDPEFDRLMGTGAERSSIKDRIAEVASRVRDFSHESWDDFRARQEGKRSGGDRAGMYELVTR